MIASLAAEGYDTVSAPFGHALVDLARKDDRIVGLTADLGKYTDLHIFGREMPDRYYQMGMAEQVMVSAAAGMAREGFVPFATTYAVFASRRAYDFIAMAIAEEYLPVKIMCALPGLTTGYGPSHQATEDLAIFRGLPNMTIVDPCDADDITGMVPEIVAHPGPVYARLLRGKVAKVLTKHKPDYRFELGRAQMIREGRDVLVIASGLHDHAGSRRRRAARRGRDRRGRAAQPHDQAARHRDDPGRGGQGWAAGGDGGEPYRRRRARRGGGARRS